MGTESLTTLSSGVASVLSLDRGDTREDPQTPPMPLECGPSPEGSVLSPYPYLVAWSVTSARSRRMEQLNSSSRVKDTWGGSERCGGGLGVSRGSWGCRWSYLGLRTEDGVPDTAAPAVPPQC